MRGGEHSSEEAARLVRPAPSGFALAGEARDAARPLLRLAQRDHAAADHRRRREGIFHAFHRPLANPRGARRGGARRGAARLAGARLLCKGAQPAQMRDAGRLPTRRPLPRQRAGSARAPRDRRLHRGGDPPPSPSTEPASAVDGNVERVDCPPLRHRGRRCRDAKTEIKTRACKAGLHAAFARRATTPRR